MDEKERSLESEKDRLKYVLTFIEKTITKTFDSFMKKGRNLTKEYRDLWEDKDAIDEREYKERKQVLSVYEQIESHQVRKIRTLEKLRKSPYFGRIDFREDGEIEVEQIYIGIGSLFDEENLDVIIYDWRTPICSMYYEYSLGHAQYSSEVGVIKGDILKKRQFKIEDGEIKYLFDTDITIDDEVLQKMLSQPMNDKMKNIISTIQKEQNKIIRNDQYDILVVQGPAGSGKTSVALHRIAYLLYKHRKTLGSKEIIIFSPNDIFNDYISEVLPELGEEKVQQSTFLHYFSTPLQKKYNIQTFDEHMQFIMTQEDRSKKNALQKKAIRYKATWEFCQVVDAYIEYVLAHEMSFKDIIFREKLILTKEELENLFYNHYALLAPSKRLKRLKKRIHEYLSPHLKARFEEIKKWVEKEKVDIAGLSFFEQEVKEATAEMLKDEFAPLKHDIDSMTHFDYYDVYVNLFTNERFINEVSHKVSHKEDLLEYGKVIKERKLKGVIAYEDVAPLLYIQYSLTGVDGLPPIKQVVIDEAQDYSPIQYKLLAKRFIRSQFTLLGDINQVVHPYMNVGRYDECLALFGNKKSIFVELMNSYRNTKQIGDFSDQMLIKDQSLKKIKHLNRQGEKVKVSLVHDARVHYSKITETLNNYKENQLGHIGLICKNIDECFEAYNVLKDQFQDLYLITDGEADFKKGISILPIYLAKGLEFEGVILFNANKENYHNESHRKLLYTGVTRALHQIHIFCRQELTPFISSMEKKLYDYEIY